MDVSRSDFARVRELFERARGLDPSARRALLDSECASQSALRVEVEELLASSSEAGVRFERSPLELVSAGLAPPSIRGFRILGRISTGANGDVYRALESASDRTVALKVLRADADDQEAVRRFAREAAILAKLRHPAIAGLVASNVGDPRSDTAPWIATEWVDGRTLHAYAAEFRHDAHEVLSLFAEICDAVAHAHRHGVVHRDLKPANILVDRSGKPRVLDFGIARLLERSNSATTKHTRTGALLGTLAYMAPEQARGDLAAVGAHSDVYALGVILFELLTARSARDLRGLDLLAAVRVVSDSEPLRLRDLRSDLPPDLDLVLARALEAAPANRYPSAAELADDVRAVLASQRVRPMRWAWARRAGRFVRRNRAASATALALLLILSSLLAASLYALRVEREQLASTGRTLDWMARQLLRRSPSLDSENVERELRELRERLELHLLVEPENLTLRAALAATLGECAGLAQARGDFPEQARLAQAALDLRHALLRTNPDDFESLAHTATLHAKLGEAARDQGDGAGCERHFALALEVDEELVRLRPDDLELREDLGWSLARCAQVAAGNGDQPRAESLHARRLEDARRIADAAPQAWKFLFNLSHALYYAAGFEELRGDFSRALELTREADEAIARAIAQDPLRRSLIQWRLNVLRRSSGYAYRLGDQQAGVRDAESALGLAEQLVTVEPRHADHFRQLAVAARELARCVQSSNDASTRSRTGATLERLASLALFCERTDTAAELRELAARARE